MVIEVGVWVARSAGLTACFFESTIRWRIVWVPDIAAEVVVFNFSYQISSNTNPNSSYQTSSNTNPISYSSPLSSPNSDLHTHTYPSYLQIPKHIFFILPLPRISSWLMNPPNPLPHPPKLLLFIVTTLRFRPASSWLRPIMPYGLRSWRCVLLPAKNWGTALATPRNLLSSPLPTQNGVRRTFGWRGGSLTPCLPT